MKPKLLRFVIDCSGSMYYFNGHDGRLERTLQTAVMIFEAFAGFEHKYRYSMVGHSGDTPCAPLVEYGLPPPNEKERLKVVQRMAAHTQFCMSGDHTLEATRLAEAAPEQLEHRAVQRLQRKWRAAYAAIAQRPPPSLARRGSWLRRHRGGRVPLPFAGLARGRLGDNMGVGQM